VHDKSVVCIPIVCKKTGYASNWSLIEQTGSSYIVTYNLHGFNNGRNCLVDLCNAPVWVLLHYKAHWLSPNRLHLLNEVHPDFFGCGISPMSDKWVNEIFRGRPYGGVGFLWRTKFSGTSISFKASSGRIIAKLLELDSNRKLNIVSLYFPCYVMEYSPLTST